MTWTVALAQDELGGLAQLVLLVVFLLVSGLAKLFKTSQQKQTLQRPRRRNASPSEPAEEELTWQDLLRGRVEPRPAAPVVQPAKPTRTTQTIEGHSASERPLAPHGVLAELPTESELEAQEGDAMAAEVEGATKVVPLASMPAEAVLAMREMGAASAAMRSGTARRAARRPTLADWRRAIVVREVLGPPLATRWPARDPLA